MQGPGSRLCKRLLAFLCSVTRQQQIYAASATQIDNHGCTTLLMSNHPVYIGTDWTGILGGGWIQLSCINLV